MSSQRISLQEHTQWVQQGYQANEKAICYRWGDVYSRMQYTKEEGIFAKTGRVSMGIIGSLATCCLLPCCSNSFVEETWSYPVEGCYERLVYNKKETERIHRADAKKLGFSSLSRDSINNFLKTEEGQKRLKKAHGHYYLTYFGPVSHGSMIIFVPYKNFNKVMCIALHHQDTGLSYTPLELDKNAILYCATYIGNNGTTRIHTESTPLHAGVSVTTVTSVQYLNVNAGAKYKREK